MALAARWLAWWVAYLAVWTVATSLAPAELVAGALVAGLAATLSLATGRTGEVRFRLDASILRPFLRTPFDVARDTVVVSRAILGRLLGRPTRSRSTAVPFPQDPADEAGTTARNAIAPVGITLSPNTVVVGVDRDRGLLLVHQLVPQPDVVAALSRWAAQRSSDDP